MGGRRRWGDGYKPMRPKTFVAGVKDRAAQTLMAQVVPDTKARTLAPFVMSQIEPGAKVNTDEYASYARIPNRETVVHSVAQYVNGHAHTNGLESFWTLLKRGYHGTFHHVSPKHLDR